MSTSQRPESYRKLMCSATLTLTLSILGTSVLPVPFAFSRTGVLLGLLVALLVASANTLTGQLLLEASGRLHHDSYEGLAEAIAGRTGKLVTQFSLVLLLFGGFTGACALLSDVGLLALDPLFGGNPPWILAAGGGRGVMLLLVLGVCLPLSLMRHMRSLEHVAMLGLVPLFILMVIMVVDSLKAGMPAIASGELPLWQVKVNADLPEAIAVLGYAFYFQPMLLPLLHEMPRGAAGVSILRTAVRVTVMGVATAVYSVVGIFAAARWGQQTQGDCLMNEWVSGKWGGALTLAMAAYLAVSAVPVQMSLRYTLTALIAGEDAPFLMRRHVAVTVISVLLSLALAAVFPRYSEKIFAATGALPVCLICYIIPVWLHLQLYFRDNRMRWRFAVHGSDHKLPLLGERQAPYCTSSDPPRLQSLSSVLGQPHHKACMTAWRFFRDVTVPVAVAVVMTGFSAVAFWTSLRAFFGDDGSGSGDRLQPFELASM